VEVEERGRSCGRRGFESRAAAEAEKESHRESWSPEAVRAGPPAPNLVALENEKYF